MPTSMTKDQRNLLSRVTLEAREAAETAARAALENLAVHEHEYRGHMTVDQRLLRNRLRARGRALGDRLDPRTDTQAIDHLAESAAYEHWHRLLFTRLLAENHLLHTDEALGTVPVTLEECGELAAELGARDGFELACRFASQILPGVFRRDDPVLALRLAPNHEVQLRRLLDQLPPELFRADDALGWTYQFWQAKRKDQINRSGVKIGADELPAVTQLFTEDYMVELLLHNSIGAWWAGKESGCLAPTLETEKEARKAVALPSKDCLPGIDWTYLRFVKEPGHPVGPGHLAPESGAGRPHSFAPAPFVDPFAEIEVTANMLPHWQQGEAWIFVTWRLADSLPAEKLRQWQEEKDAWLARHPEPWDTATNREYHERFTHRIEDWLDAGHGGCILRQPEVRQIVAGALAFLHGKRYELGDWAVMPNHVHALFRPLGEHRLAEILHSWKSFTAKAINKHLGRTGPVWQEDYWDRLIRNERHLDACERYIAANPAKAHLPAGAWSGCFSQRSGGVPPPIPGRDAPPPLQVAVARLLGYRWPRQTGSEFPDCPAIGPDGLESHADADGIVCLPPINKEQPAAVRLRSLLVATWSGGVPPPSPGRNAPAPFDERDLLAATGAKQTNLEDWLRDAFFEQHCKLFKNRPFVWHIWDGRKDGFHALVNYHRLDHATLQKLTYSYLGDWIRQQDADAKADKPGAAERLGAAQALEAELMKILEGEPPYDLFIRWKPLKEQPLGWQPDLNDGVRLNIRPFLLARDLGKKDAGILRAKPNIKWVRWRARQLRRHRDGKWLPPYKDGCGQLRASALDCTHLLTHRKVYPMRTNIVLDQELVDEAMGYANVKTKRELVDLALREFVAARRRRDVSELFGKVQIDPDYDYKALRREDA